MLKSGPGEIFINGTGVNNNAIIKKIVIEVGRILFNEFNDQQEELGKERFANPRNAAAGSLRQKDPRVTASRPLSMVVHGIGAASGVTFDSQSAAYELLKGFGLPTSSRYKVVKSAAEVSEFVAYYADHRHDIEHEIDGIVIKVNEIPIQNELGHCLCPLRRG